MASGISSWTPPQWKKFENTEKVVGTWIDGSLVYERTISGNLPTSLKTYQNGHSSFTYLLIVTLPVEIRNTINIIKISGSVNWAYGTDHGTLILPMGRDYSNSVYPFYVLTGDIGITGEVNNYKGQHFEITIEYVK